LYSFDVLILRSLARLKEAEHAPGDGNIYDSTEAALPPWHLAFEGEPNNPKNVMLERAILSLVQNSPQISSCADEL
jgi:hypothetical protein